MLLASLVAAVSVVVLVACSNAASPPPGPVKRPQPPEDQTVRTPDVLVPPALRLPDTVRPTRIALDLTIVPSRDTFAGVMIADVDVTTAIDVVWLNARGLTISAAKLDGVAAEFEVHGDDFLAVRAPGLAAGKHTVEVAYEAPIDHERSQGVYAEQEGDATYAYTFFEPVDGRRAFPCWDEPAFKIPWQLTFHVQDTDVALGNAAVVRETPEDGGMKKVELEDSLPMPSYLVAFVVGPFELVDGGAGGRIATPIRFVIPKGRSAELRYAKEITPKVVAALEDYFDMDYPYGKLDVAVVPRFWGTMEHPGLVAMGQPLTLIPPDQETRGRRERYTNILAHELAHYWFGDYVTMAWWDDTWLNEALGQWLDMRITDAAEPSWHHPDDRVGMAEWGMAADELLAARKIRQSVTTLEGIAASFDNGITYAKGSVVMRMFEMYVGEDNWREFLRAYVRAFAWGNATADDFVGTMRAQLGDDVATAFTTFLEQPGVPVLDLSATCEVSQRRSLAAGVTEDTPRLWRVPMCVRWPGGEHCEIVSAATQALSLETCPPQVMLNRGAYGYYRSAHTAAEAKQLLAPPKKKSKSKAWLDSAERRTVVGDVLAGVKRGEIAVGDALGLVATLVADADDRVAVAGLSIAGLMDGRALDDDLYQRERRWAVKALGPLARKLGWTRGKADSDDRHQLRLAIVPWVAASGDAKLATQATKLARQWLADRKAVADDVADAVLGVAAAVGDAKLFDELLAAARASTERRDQARLLGALGGFRDPELATRALALVAAGEFDLRDAEGIVYGVLSTRETRDLGWAFVLEHLDALLAQMRDDEAGGTLAGVTSLFCDQAHRDAAAAAFEPRAAKIAGAENALATALERVDQCIAAQARNVDGITRFLAAY